MQSLNLKKNLYAKISSQKANKDKVSAKVSSKYILSSNRGCWDLLYMIF